jgi:cytochrome c556
MIRIVVVAVAVAVAVTAVVAQNDPIATRMGLMKKNDQHRKSLRSMVKGETPFDVNKVNEAFDQWADTAANLPSLFPDNSKTGQKTRALPKIWTDNADFRAKIAAFGKAVAEQKSKAQTLAGLKTAFPVVSDACDNCHKDYRASRKRSKKK